MTEVAEEARVQRQSWRRLLPVVALAVVSGLLFQAGVPLRASSSSWTTGDEPFYLLTAESLVRDGDLDLANQYDQQAYRAFFDHPDPLWHQEIPAPDGRRLAPHNTGLPLLVAPAYAAGGAALVKRFLGAMAALAVVMTLLAARRVAGNRAALFASLLLAVSAPFFVYATQVYPEMPAALAVAVALWLVLDDRLSDGPRLALLLASLVALPWLGSKYVLVAATLTAFGLWRMRWRERSLSIGVLAFAGFAYLWFHLDRFGGLTPYAVNAIDARSDSLVAGLHLDLGDRVYRVLGLFVDRDFGLIRWSPVLLLTVPGAVDAVRRFGWRGWLLAATFLVQLVVAVFLSLTMRGWWFPGRMLIAVLPVMGIWLALTLDRVRTLPWLGIAGGLGALTAWTTFALWQAASAHAVTLAVDPFALADPLFSLPAGLFPLYTAYGIDTWLLSGVWLVVLVGIAAIPLGIARRGRPVAARVDRPQAGGGLEIRI